MLEYEVPDRSSPEPIKPWDAYVTILALNDKGLVPPYPGSRPEYQIIRSDLYKADEIGVKIFPKTQGDRDEFIDRHYPRWPVTEETWKLAHWPPVVFGGDEGDGEAENPSGWVIVEEVETDLPKPTWQQVLTANRERRIRYIGSQLRPLPEYVQDAENAALLAEIHNQNPDISLEPHEGIDHLAAVVHQISRTSSAGKVNTVSVLRDAEQAPKSLWTEDEKTRIVDPVAAKAVMVGSAVNVVKGKIFALQEIAFGTDGGLAPGASEHEIAAARISALEQAIELAQADKLDADISAEIARLRAADLPDDFETAKQVLVERLEAAATGHQKRLKSALTQQAIDNWAACVDQDNAMTEIARQCAIGRLAIRKAEDQIWEKNSGAWAKSDFAEFVLSLPPNDRVPGVDVQHTGAGDPDVALGADGEFYRDTASGLIEAKASFRKYKAEIESVTAENTPHWVVNDAETNEAFPARQSISGRELRVRAVQPFGAKIADNVNIKPIPTIVDAKTRGPVPAIRTLRRPTNRLEHEIVVVLAPTVTSPVIVTVEAANLCGPSEIEILMTP